jgi:DNA-binding HxlR family transcriptional regulator
MTNPSAPAPARTRWPGRATLHARDPPRVEYEITELGRSLAPLFAALVEWSSENLPKVEHARRTYDGDA